MTSQTLISAYTHRWAHCWSAQGRDGAREKTRDPRAWFEKGWYFCWQGYPVGLWLTAADGMIGSFTAHCVHSWTGHQIFNGWDLKMFISFHVLVPQWGREGPVLFYKMTVDFCNSPTGWRVISHWLFSFSRCNVAPCRFLVPVSGFLARSLTPHKIILISYVASL